MDMHKTLALISFLVMGLSYKDVKYFSNQKQNKITPVEYTLLGASPLIRRNRFPVCLCHFPPR
jgi:hypothetical protein